MVFPHTPPSVHLNWFHNLLINHQLMAEEERRLSFDHCTWDGPIDQVREVLDSRPSIICTFHTGSYRFLNAYLLKKEKLPLTLLANEEFIESDLLYRFREPRHGAFQDEAELKTIAAETPSIYFNKNVRLLRSEVLEAKRWYSGMKGKL